jgi:hypothetical protein
MGAATWALGFYPLTATCDETAGGHDAYDAYDASRDYRRYARVRGGDNPITRHIRHGVGFRRPFIRVESARKTRPRRPLAEAGRRPRG